MLSTVFLVPLLSIILFLFLGNENRANYAKIMPAIGLLTAWFLGTEVLVSLLILTLPFFFLREFLDRLSKEKYTKAICLAVVFLFVFLKDYFGWGAITLNYFFTDPMQSQLNLFLGAMGLSFVLFRVLEYLLVAKNQRQTGMFLWRLWLYIGFCFAMPTITSGPVLRWLAYRADCEKNGRIFDSRKELMRSLHRLSNGLLKISVISQPMLLVILVGNDTLSNNLSNSIEFAMLGTALAVFYLHFLYVNFLSFSDIMIASGRMVGLRLPENFNRPFGTFGFLDFFNHWHLSVSQWFRDFVFTPILRSLILRGWKSNVIMSAVAFFITFGLLGLWHGRTWPFILCGLMLALGAIVNQVYREVGRKKVQNILKGSVGEKIVNEWMRAFTYVYISVAIMGLWLRPAALIGYWDATMTPTFALCFILFVTAYSLLINLISKLSIALGVGREKLEFWSFEGGVVIIAAKAVVGVLIFQYFSVETGINFVYEGF